MASLAWIMLTLLLSATALAAGWDPNWWKKNQKECGANAEWVQCSLVGTNCSLNCENVGKKLEGCILPCIPACDCRPGYIFRVGKEGDCIERKDCPGQDLESIGEDEEEE